MSDRSPQQLAGPSYVGYLGGLQGDDETLVPVERTVAAVDDVHGRLVVLTRDGAAVFPLPPH